MTISHERLAELRLFYSPGDVDVSEMRFVDRDTVAIIDELISLRREWIPVSERLPEKPDFYLTLEVDLRRPEWPPSHFIRYFRGGKHFWSGQTTTADSVTHWMPLPPPPEGGGS